jgi:hypothetical protein
MPGLGGRVHAYSRSLRQQAGRFCRFKRSICKIRFIRSVPLQAARFLMLKQQLFFPVAVFSQTQLLLSQFKARPRPFSA